MAATTNRQMVLTRHVKGSPPDDVFSLVGISMAEPGPGQILIRNHLASVEPGIAGAITGEDVYAVPAYAVGDIIRSCTVGTVIKSRSPVFAEGDLVHAWGGWQDYAVLDATPDLAAQLCPYKIDTSRVPLETWMGPLGLSAFIAYIGIKLVANPRPGETAVISAAAGAVGGMAGQYARIAGARAVGIAGGQDKCHYVQEELKFDATLDYRKKNLGEQLDRHCPDGIDIYFENVGGAVLDAVWPRLNTFSRVPICGQIAQYQMSERPAGPNLFDAVIKRMTLTGIVVVDQPHSPYFEQFREDTLQWLEQGKIHLRLDIVDGLENAVQAWKGLLAGKNMGKRLLRISAPKNKSTCSSSDIVGREGVQRSASAEAH